MGGAGTCRHTWSLRGALVERGGSYAEPTGGDMGPGTLPSGLRDMLQPHPITASGTGIAVARGSTGWDPHSLIACWLLLVPPIGQALTLKAKCLGQLEGAWGVLSVALPQDLPRQDTWRAVLLPV